jgi:hypothetical protein
MCVLEEVIQTPCHSNAFQEHKWKATTTRVCNYKKNIRGNFNFGYANANQLHVIIREDNLAQFDAHLPTVQEIGGFNPCAYQIYLFFVYSLRLTLQSSVSFEHHDKVQNNNQRKTL